MSFMSDKRISLELLTNTPLVFFLYRMWFFCTVCVSFLLYRCLGLMTKPLHLCILHQNTSIPLNHLLQNPLLIHLSAMIKIKRGDLVIPHRTSLNMLLSSPSSTVHHYWRMFDDAFMRPMFGGRGFVPQAPNSLNDTFIQ